MNIKLEYFSDNALAHLEAALDTAICSSVDTTADPDQLEHLVDRFRLVVEERMRRESARR